MGLFGDIFKQKEETISNFNWIPLTTIAQLDEILANSTNNTQAIFKHSTRCGISSMVIKQFEKQNENLENMDFYYLDLLRYREISNEIAIKFAVPHQSPQLIVIKDNKVVVHDSHHGILSLKLN